VIYESLAYIHNSLLPTLIQHHLTYFQTKTLQDAILDFLDILSLRFEREPGDKIQSLKLHDQEEYLYRDAMLTQFVNLCLVLLKYSPSHHLQVYSLFDELLAKTQGAYSLSDSFTTMEGIQLLL
jgi:hypothetical protein